MSKTIILLTSVTLLSLVAYIKYSQPQTNYYDLMAQKINNDSQSTWKAQIYPNLIKQVINKQRNFNLQIEEKLPDNFDEMPTHKLTLEDLPVNFDAREKWSQCSSIREIWDQSACGSCWALAAASSMSDRLCIKNNKDQRRISPEDLLECCESCGFGCDGGLLYNSWSHWKSKGLVTGEIYGDKNSCKPYLLPPCNHHGTKGPYDDCSNHDYAAPLCEEKCSNENYPKEYKDDKIKSQKVYKVDSQRHMLKELVENGPFEIAMRVYEDFILYKEGVYQHKQGQFLGFHAIRLIGYGEENGVKYWLCANSWNDSWGDKGFFKILRGGNHCGTETDGVAGLAQQFQFCIYNYEFRLLDLL